MRIVLHLMRFVLAAVYLVAGVLKLGDTQAFAVEIANYHFLPDLARPLAITLPTIEIVIGAALLLPLANPWFQAAALAGTGMMAVFTVAVAQVLARGINIDCGCFGGASSPVTWLTLARDVALLGFGVFVLQRTRVRKATAQEE